MMNARKLVCSALLLACALVCGASASAVPAVLSLVIHDFNGGSGGGDPAGRLTGDKFDNLYGTTVVGGTSGCGTVFELPVETTQRRPEAVIHSFSCGLDGKNPYGGVILDAAGDLFGTTVAGGSGGICAGDGCGVVYEITPHGEQVLHNFTGGSDGFGPGGGLAFDNRGHLFGTTPDGGVDSFGTVYELTQSSGVWRERVIHSFTGGADGATGSLGTLLVDAAGDLFGVTEAGGASGAGTVFEMLPNAGGTWTFRTLYAFKGSPDAASPYGGLIADAKGNLYGTTYYGGTHGDGAVFSLRSESAGRWHESVLYDFKGGMDGANPTSTLKFDPAGGLVGTTTMGGGSCDCGTVFNFRLSTLQETVIHRFGASGDGQYPYYGAIIDDEGRMYTTTANGGEFNQGAAIQVTGG